MTHDPQSDHDGDASTYFTDPTLTPADVAELFEVAAALWAAAPWRHVSAEAMLHVGVEARGLEDAALSVLGDGRGVFGFMLYDSMEDYDAVLDELGELDEDDADDEDAAEGGANPDARVMSLVLEPARELPEGMLEEASKHGWPLPAPGRYPSLARIADGAPAKVTRSDFQLLLALARALTAFSREHAEALESYGELPVRETYADRDGLELVLTVPHPEVDLDDLQEPPRAQTLPGVHNPYGLPLSKKELAQLDKALGSFTLDRLIGVFCAVVSVPATLPPKRWMAMIAPSVKVADAVEFRALSDAMLRAYNHVAERMQAWSIAELVPVSAAPEACRAWARGYVSVCDEVELPEQKGELVDSLFGVYVAAEVPRYLTILDAHLEGATRAEHIAQRQELLADDVAYLYEGWERARRETAERALAKPVPIKVAPKAGRNDPCPCGSGKKHKKCCA